MADETPSSSEANEKLQQSQEHFEQASDDLKSAANAKLDDLKGKASAKFEDIKSTASAKADEYRAAASAKADEYRAAATAKADELRGKAEAAWGEAKGRARTVQEDGEEYIRQNPTRAVLMGLGAGFILGLILRK